MLCDWTQIRANFFSKTGLCYHCRVGQTCCHIAALLYRVEAGNWFGLTSCTSNKSTWNVPKDLKSMEPCEISTLCSNLKKSSRAKAGKL